MLGPNPFVKRITGELLENLGFEKKKIGTDTRDWYCIDIDGIPFKCVNTMVDMWVLKSPDQEYGYTVESTQQLFDVLAIHFKIEGKNQLKRQYKELMS